MIDGTAHLQPFQLHLINNANDPEVPPGLSNLVHIHRDLNYDKFYSLIQLMDMILPAFGSLECLSFRFVFQVVHFLILPLSADYEAKASFTMAISLECNTHSYVIDLFSKHAMKCFPTIHIFLIQVPILVNQWVQQTAVKALHTGQWSHHISKTCFSRCL
jgi:hypothetical protein